VQIIPLKTMRISVSRRVEPWRCPFLAIMLGLQKFIDQLIDRFLNILFCSCDKLVGFTGIRWNSDRVEINSSS